jgi:putative oxidoreductase
MILDTKIQTRIHSTVAQPGWAHRAANRFFATDRDITGLLLRLGLAVTMFPHGAQKALGLWGGFGFSNTVGFFVQGGMPTALAVAVIAAEFLGPIALVAGFFTRWSAFGIGLVMLGAAGMAHAKNGFFMNWMGTQKGEGIEYFIPVLTIAIALMIKGSGSWAVDRLISRRIDSQKAI